MDRRAGCRGASWEPGVTRHPALEELDRVLAENYRQRMAFMTEATRGSLICGADGQPGPWAARPRSGRHRTTPGEGGLPDDVLAVVRHHATAAIRDVLHSGVVIVDLDDALAEAVDGTGDLTGGSG